MLDRFPTSPPAERPARPRFGVAAAWLALGLLAAAPATLPAQTMPQPRDLRPRPEAAPGPTERGTPKQVLGQNPAFLNDTVVRIEIAATDGAETSGSLGSRRAGTGVLIGADTVLTIGYLLLEAEDVTLVTPHGRRIPGNVAAYDHATGFGIVRSVLPLEGRPLELGDSDAVTEMQRVATLGHGEPAATELLVVSRKAFTGSWEYVLDSGIYTFPPVNNWSGAALVDGGGKLVGIGSLIVNDAASARPGVPGNLYVPVNLLKPILAELLATGKRGGPAQPWLGVSTEVVQGNLMVSRVTRDGPADRAGLTAGDIIVGIDGDKVSSQSAFYRRLWQQGPAGVTVSLRVLKAGDVRDIPVTTVDRSAVLRKPRGV